MREGKHKLQRLREGCQDQNLVDQLAEQFSALADEVFDTFNEVESCNVLWNELRDRLGTYLNWLDKMEQRIAAVPVPVVAFTVQV